jgi:ABC-type branched-subunit amino acid transport system ATPase component
MIEAVEVERFRGFRRLKVEGLGRVNLIIGRNNSGKTALMEAVAVAAGINDTAYVLAALQGLRLPNESMQDLNRFWMPFFLNNNADNGFTVRANVLNGENCSVTVRKGDAPHELAVKSRPRAVLNGIWAIEIRITVGEHERTVRISASSEKINFPEQFNPNRNYWYWVEPHKNLGPVDVRCFSDLKQAGRESLLLDVLRNVDPRLSGIELLAPSGAQAEIFVRLAPDAPLLDIAMMGDGFQRCFEIGVSAVGADVPLIFIDEFENGLHHSVLEPVWRWLASTSTIRNLQVFVTTHSEECVQAACRAFTAANDDGLRVIRLDQREEETVATVYDRSLVEAATRMGVEIRG